MVDSASRQSTPNHSSWQSRAEAARCAGEEEEEVITDRHTRFSHVLVAAEIVDGYTGRCTSWSAMARHHVTGVERQPQLRARLRRHVAFLVT